MRQYWPLSVKLLFVFLLGQALWQLIRVWSVFHDIRTIIGLIGQQIGIYLLVQSTILMIFPIYLTIAIAKRLRWTLETSYALFLINTILYWMDRLIIQSHYANIPFAIILSGGYLGIASLLVLNKKAKSFFK